MGNTKYLLLGTERSGSTLLSSILAKADANFGFEKNREWYRGSGDYEHNIIIDTYKNLKRALYFKNFSDSLSSIEQKKIINKMKRLFSIVDYAKYPPLSQYLPIYIKKAGFDVRLIVVIRKFNDFAMSRIAKNGGNCQTCKDVYLNMYKTTLLNLALYGGCIVLYEDIIDPTKTRWAEVISETCGLSMENLIEARDKNAKATVAKNIINQHFTDKECEDIYDAYKELSGNVYLPDSLKQHI